MLLLLAGLAGAQTLTVGDLTVGDLVITEVMRNPNAVDDTAGEWFEVYNNAGMAVDLLGLEVRDYGTDAATIATSAVVPAGGYAVIAKNGDPAVNGGVNDIAVASLTLANTADELSLQAYGLVIDEIWWDTGWPDPVGATMSLDPAYLYATGNDSGLNWCDGVSPFGAGDLGTPGAANPSCSGGTTGTGTGAGTGTGGGTGSGTGGGTGSGTGGGTGSGTGGGTGSGTGGGTGSGTGGRGTATGAGTGTGGTPPEYSKLGCGCTASGAGPTPWLLLALPLIGLRRR